MVRSQSSSSASSSMTQPTRSVKVYLSSYICEHQIWQEVRVWRLSLQRLINLKFHDAVKAQEKAREDQQRAQQSSVQNATQSFTQVAGGILNTVGLGSIGSRFKGSFFGGGSNSPNDPSNASERSKGFNTDRASNKSSGSSMSAAAAKSDGKPKPQTMKISKVLAQNIIFNTTSQFISYFVNLKLPFESSRELLMHFCKKYELDQGRTHLLLSELESVQKNARYAITYKDIK